MSIRRVIKAHKASYADPIRVFQGEAVTLEDKTDLWDGYTWIWATDLRGKSGWAPDHLAPDGVATEDYHAIELSCLEGDVLIQSRSTHGWAWCRDKTGNEGWVPLRNLAPQQTKNPAS